MSLEMKPISGPMFKQVCIIGVGLIGGSIGLALKKRGICGRVVGVVRREESIRETLDIGAVDDAFTQKDLREAVQDSDLVVLCGPIYTIIEYLHVLHRHIKPNCLVIDVGSTKFEIEKAASQYFNKPGSAVFVGCHPMAGSEKRGVSHASENLFEGAVCFVTQDYLRVNSLWEALGAVTVPLSAEEHDSNVSQISHLPHVLAFAIFQKYGTHVVPLTNPSIRDFIRLSKSDPDLWCDVFLSNRDNVVSDIVSLQKTLSEWVEALGKRDSVRIKQFIRIANEKSPVLIWGKIVDKKLDENKDAQGTS